MDGKIWSEGIKFSISSVRALHVLHHKGVILGLAPETWPAKSNGQALFKNYSSCIRRSSFAFRMSF